MRKTNLIKTVIVAVVMTAALGTLTGCSVEKNFNKTVTHTVTDADGNSTTTTTVNHNGEITTETYTTSADDVKTPVEVEEIDTAAPEIFDQVPIAIANNMGFDIASLNIKMSTEDDWSNNLIGEGVVIEDGIVARGIWVTFDEENRYIDLHLEDVNGEDLEFNGLALPTEFDEEIVLEFEYNEEEGSYTVYAIS